MNGDPFDCPIFADIFGSAAGAQRAGVSTSSEQQEAVKLWRQLVDVIQARRWSATATLTVVGGLFLELCERCNEDSAAVLADIKQSKANHKGESRERN